MIDNIMIDIIIINESIFLENKKTKEADAIITTIQEKYNEIFKKYPCFSATQVNSFIPTTKSIEQQQFYRNYSNNKKQFHKENESINPFISKKPKELERIILGILNVLNHSNYNKMLTKIRLIKSDNNIAIIINEILQKCSMQIFYINIYMKLLKDIINLCTDQEKKIVFENINLYVNQYIILNEWMNEYIINIDDEYNSFCIKQKQKATLIAKNIMIYNLITLFNLTKNIKDYSMIIINDLKLNIENKNEDCSILLFQMLIFITKTEKKIIKEIGNWDFDYIHSKISSNKFKFIVEEFIALIN